MKSITEMEIELGGWIDELGFSAMEILPIQVQFATGFFLIRNIAQNKNNTPKELNTMSSKDS